MSTAPKDFANEVRGHYEELPYPYRDVATEGQFLYGADGFSANALNHFGWGGRKDLRAKGTRILIAGDGTGDGSINWAESLVGSEAEIVAIDLSSRSIETAKARLAKRQLTNVTHHHMSLLDLPDSGLGQFDIIECSGVLHHLPDPDAGLAALGKMLKDDGIMALMVYAQYGRTAIYMIQDMLRRMMRPDMTRSEKIALARGFLNNVPNTHLLTVKNEAFLEDISWPDGSGIYDLLLHTTDRAYTVPQLYEWVEGAGLKLQAMFADFTDDSTYLPHYYTNEPTVLAALEGKSTAELYAIGELMHGTIIKHNFYVTKQAKQPAEFADDMVISYGMLQSMFLEYVPGLVQQLTQVSMGERVGCVARPFPGAAPLIVTRRPSTPLLLQAIDDRSTVGQIVAAVTKSSKLSRNDVRKDLQLLYSEMRARMLVFLRHESVPAYPTGMQMRARLKHIGLIS